VGRGGIYVAPGASLISGIILIHSSRVFITGAGLNGQVFAQTAVTLQMNTITQPASGVAFGTGRQLVECRRRAYGHQLMSAAVHRNPSSNAVNMFAAPVRQHVCDVEGISEQDHYDANICDQPHARRKLWGFVSCALTL
jgi:hypothetical protein